MPLHSPNKNKAEDGNISVHAYDGGSVFAAEPSICFWFTLKYNGLILLIYINFMNDKSK